MSCATCCCCGSPSFECPALPPPRARRSTRSHHASGVSADLAERPLALNIRVITATHCHNATPLAPQPKLLSSDLFRSLDTPTTCPPARTFYRFPLTVATTILGTTRSFVRLCCANHHFPLPSPLTSFHSRAPSNQAWKSIGYTYIHTCLRVWVDIVAAPHPSPNCVQRVFFPYSGCPHTNPLSHLPLTCKIHLIPLPSSDLTAICKFFQRVS